MGIEFGRSMRSAEKKPLTKKERYQCHFAPS